MASASKVTQEQPTLGVNEHWKTRRNRTAIGRTGLSMPARLAQDDGVLNDCSSILDYGSGRGQDVERLRAMGRTAIGWDPYFDAQQQPEAADAVLLTYVLNVIEDADEGRDTLGRAWELTSRVMVVSTRLSWDAKRVNGDECDDGVVTSRGTFQHLYRPTELRDLVTKVTGVRCVAAAPGVVYAFKNDRDRLAFLGRRTLPNYQWANVEGADEAMSAVTRFAEMTGRVPAFEELPIDHVEALGELSSRELSRLVKVAADPERVANGAKKSTLDTLLYLGIELFTGRGPYGSLPLNVKLNVRRFFPSYKDACRRADRLLLKLRDDTYLRGAMRNSVGKMTPTALYVHDRAVSSMPVILRLYEHCGAIAAGRPAAYTLLKLHHDKRAVSWLGYTNFDTDPHPRTDWSYQVAFPHMDATYTDFSTRTNRPLLHRKEEFLASDDPDRQKYERLTRSEVKAGLYENPSIIGTEKGWESELARCGVALRGHRLVRASPG